MGAKEAISQRFWRKVAVAGVDECWLWQAALDRKGYGVVGVGAQIARSHRVAWKLVFREELTPDVKLCHTCDTPRCVNPLHLFKGTPRDNCLDMWRKGRANHASGERAAGARLTEAKVESIRELYRTGLWTHRGLAAHFKVSHTAIGLVLRGLSWKSKYVKKK